MKKKLVLFFIFFLFIKQAYAQEDIMIMKLKDGDVIIELFGEIAPEHVKRFKLGFMAQTGDVQFGNPNLESFDLRLAGTGGSEYPDLKAEFSDIPHEKGTLSMARSNDPNSANSQFFICFKSAPHLDRNYSVFGKVIKGMEFVDLIKKGVGSNGEVSNPDKIISLSAQ